MTLSFQPMFLPATSEIRDAFREEIKALGGSVAETFDDGERLFLRAVLPADAEVRPGDRVNAGVALRVVDREVVVHPYTFRQICSNGAIAAHVLDTRRIERVEAHVMVPTYETTVAMHELRAAVQASAAPELFAGLSSEMRAAADTRASHAMNLMMLVARMPGTGMSERAADALLRFLDAGDATVFGLMNAVTEVARDTRDPEVRWRLELLGASVPARMMNPRGFVSPIEAVIDA